MSFTPRYILPVTIGLLFYWRTLGIWFRADDFAWLGLRLSILQPIDFIKAMFSPMAQGTIRFLSERAFFLLFESIFGLHSLPFRIAIMAAFLVAGALLSSVTSKITGIPNSGPLAAVLWTVQVGLAAAMGWLSSAANQVFCSLLLLLAFWAFLERRRVICWTAYLLAFGTLETTVVFPAILLGYTLCLDRKRWKESLPFWIPALAFTALRLGVLAKLNSDPIYQMQLGPMDLAAVFAEYCRLGPGLPMAIVIAGLALWRVLSGDRTVTFGVLWLVLLLAPVLPLRNHIDVYYLALPGMALGFLLAALAFRLRDVRLAQGLPGAAAAFALIAVFVTMQTHRSYWVLRWHREHAATTRTLVFGVADAARANSGKTILLAGISNQLFWDAVFDNPWRIYGIHNVYLAPGEERAIDSHPEWGGINEWLIPAAASRQRLLSRGAVVVEMEDGKLSDATAKWAGNAERLGSGLSPFVDLGDSAFDSQLGEGWYPREGRSRWMGKQASVELGVPNARNTLTVSAYCPRVVLDAGPLSLNVRLGESDLGTQTVRQPDALFELIFPIPAQAQFSEKTTATLKLSRTLRLPGDSRDLGIVLGTIQIK